MISFPLWCPSTLQCPRRSYINALIAECISTLCHEFYAAPSKLWTVCKLLCMYTSSDCSMTYYQNTYAMQHNPFSCYQSWLSYPFSYQIPSHTIKFDCRVISFNLHLCIYAWYVNNCVHTYKYVWHEYKHWLYCPSWLLHVIDCGIILSRTKLIVAWYCVVVHLDGMNTMPKATSSCEDGHANIIHEPIDIYSRIYGAVDEAHQPV